LQYFGEGVLSAIGNSGLMVVAAEVMSYNLIFGNLDIQFSEDTKKLYDELEAALAPFLAKPKPGND
jgi:hypothetical protein